MSFTPSLSPDISETIPLSLGSAAGDEFGSVTPPYGWDVAFGGLGFLLRPSNQNPYQRATEPPRSVYVARMDLSDEAGEQSQTSWWIRSQASWDMGAGIRWYEPGADGETADRFAASQGIDVWEQGELGLLHAMDARAAVAGSQGWLCTLDKSTTQGYVEMRGETARWFGADGTTATAVTGSGAGTNDLTQPVAVGGIAWAGSKTGIWKFDTAAGTISKPITHGAGVSRIWSVKNRFIVALGNVLYEIPFTGTGAIGSAGAVAFTHSNAAWLWTDVVETGGAILASGYAAGDSAVFRFVIENDPTTGDPILSKASQVGRMPPGEAITCMGVYLGTSLVLGTSYGVRVGQASAGGDIQYGPLTIQTTNPVLDVTFRDRFAYVALTQDMGDGVSSGAARIDLSSEVLLNTGGGTGRFAWAHDALVPATGDVANSLALLGSRVVVAHTSLHYLQSATRFETVGWLESGRVRFHTVEPKAFRYARMVNAVNDGVVRLSTIDPLGIEHSIVNFDSTYDTQSDVAIKIPGRLVDQYLSFRITLEPSDDGLSSPSVGGLVIKASPAGSRVRLFQYPVSVFDSEKDRFGNTLQTNGLLAIDRIKSLETLEETGTPIVVTDWRTNEAYSGQIQSVTFTSGSPTDNSESGFGGIAIVVVRRL